MDNEKLIMSSNIVSSYIPIHAKEHGLRVKGVPNCVMYEKPTVNFESQQGRATAEKIISYLTYNSTYAFEINDTWFYTNRGMILTREREILLTFAIASSTLGSKQEQQRIYITHELIKEYPSLYRRLKKYIDRFVDNGGELLITTKEVIERDLFAPVLKNKIDNINQTKMTLWEYKMQTS